jgi:polysaccharide export outer membrane protein
MNFGLIERQYPTGTLPKYITFSPKKIINKKNDITLMPADKIYLFKYNFTDIDLLKIKNVVILKGNIKYPGIYAFEKGLKLSEILTPQQFTTNTNRNFAVIKRIYPYGEPPKYITFSPDEIFEKKKDIVLMQGDTVTFYNLYEKNINFNKIKNVVIMEGEILYPSTYAYRENMKLSEIFKKEMITLNTDLSYAEVERRDLNTFKIKDIFKFTPEEIISGKNNVTLNPLDIVRFFPKYIQAPVKITGEVKKPLIIPYHFNMRLTYALSKANFSKNIKNLKVDIYRKASKAKTKASLERAENIKGKAVSSGELIRQNIGTIFLYDILLEKNPQLNITLNPGDRIVVKSVESDEIIEKITIHGYVKNPGVYPIKGETTLYNILKAAKGLRDKAYPQGIVILRKSVKELQKQRLTKAIIQMRKQIEKEEAGVMQADLTAQELQGRQASFESKRRLLEEMKKTEVTGRITGVIVPKDIEKLKGTIYDILLENGDEIFIPKIPSSVVIFGEVYNPSAMLYKNDFTVKDYISMSGGLTKDADKENIFVIKADGSVISSSNVNSDKFWEGRNLPEWGKPEEYSTEILDYKLSPGDGIIVPTEVHVPTMWRPLIKDVTQIIYQGALTLYTISNLK